jgi:hypothetical protein
MKESHRKTLFVIAPESFRSQLVIFGGFTGNRLVCDLCESVPVTLGHFLDTNRQSPQPQKRACTPLLVYSSLGLATTHQARAVGLLFSLLQLMSCSRLLYLARLSGRVLAQQQITSG